MFISALQDGETCVFCLSNEDKEEEYGKFIKKCGLQVHYFCMVSVHAFILFKVFKHIKGSDTPKPRKKKKKKI